MKRFVSLALALALILLACVYAQAEELPIFEHSVDWDAEYDVIVVGLGAAGASTAITAAEAGANVLVLEKAPEGHAGGNSAVCMQWAAMVDDKEQAMTYMKSMREDFETPTDEMIDVYISEVMNNEQWLTDLGAPNVTRHEWVEFPDMEGAGSIFLLTVDGNLGFSQAGLKPSGALYKFLKDKVESFENVTVWYEAPATHLVQDKNTRIVHGVEAEIDGEPVLVRAKDGVVLCCGGYESNARMLEDFNDVHDSPSLANAIYNTGDGIMMALEAGARLWHMSNIVGPNTGYRFDSDAMTFGASAGKGMLVGGDGAVYKSVGRSGHGKMLFYGNYTLALYPQRTFAIYDANSVGVQPIHHSFSEGNAWEIEHGFYTIADTIEELAEAIDVPAETLVASVEEFNAAAEYPIEEGPFYSIPISHCVGNTQGGPERGLGGEIIALDGTPIPHLYEAGELGDVWSHCYQASCNIGGGMAYGRISGTNAAAPKTDNWDGSVMEEKTPYTYVIEEPEFEVGENQYLGRGEGKGQVPMVVRVTVAEGDITDVEILEDWETPGFADRAKEETIAQIIETDQAVVDVISGATMTSVGIMSAVADALSNID
ncbi:MAG TPA: FAD-dependent oxidoreductase [Clostridiaceae bacterium]|nr:FAD-dependent oxidoreductase [Clostridiaceae bacterium]